MRCLSVQQPWAWAICAGFKRIENRTWETPYQGPVAIVASGKQTEANRATREFTGGTLPPGTFAYSAIIGTVTLSEITPLSEEVEDDPHSFGPYCWVLTDPKLFQTPIPTKPKLRLYNPTASEAAQIAAESARPGRDTSAPVFAAFARSLEMDPYSRLVHQADTYFTVFTERQWDDLERVVPRLIALDSGQPEGHYFNGFLAVIDGRHADALVSFNRALRIDPDCVRALLGRADAHAGLGNTAASEADFKRAEELNPGVGEDDPDAEGEGEG